MLQVIHHTAPNVIKKMGKKIPETLYFTGFPAIEATGFVLRSAPVVAERASTGRAATTPSAAQIPCQLDSVVLTNKKAGDTLRYLRLFVRRGDGIRTHDLCVPNAALYQTEPRLDLYIRKTRMTAFAVSKCHNTKPRMRCQQENFTLGRPSLTQWPSWENFRSVTVMTTATAPEEISIAMPTMVKVLTKPSASTIMPPKRLLMIEAAPP